MRRFIYKAELEILFQEYDIDEIESNRIKSKLFKDPFSSNSKQFQLLNDIDNISRIHTVLKSGNGNDYFIGAVKDIFDINEDLQIDGEFRKLLLSNEKVAVFIGAGVSKLLEYPLWGELASKSIHHLWKVGKISFTEKDRLNVEVSDPKQILSIFDKYCSRLDDEGRKFYESIFDKDGIIKNGNPYQYLVSPYFDWLKVTSNVEFSLVKALLKNYKRAQGENSSTTKSSKKTINEEDFYNEYIVSKNFPASNLDPDKLYYLHGRIDDIGSSIFTTEDYIRHYFSDNPDVTVKPFLVHLFQNYNVIFIGYGLTELPILEAVIGNSDKRHFALMDTKYHERNVLQIKEHYYEQLGIKPIPYFTDDDGYNRLTKVLRSWEDEIRREREKTSSTYLEERNLLEKEVK